MMEAEGACIARRLKKNRVRRGLALHAGGRVCSYEDSAGRVKVRYACEGEAGL